MRMHHAFTVLALLVIQSCGKVCDDYQDPLRFDTAILRHKSILGNAEMLPPGYTVYASSYFDCMDGKSSSGDYFVGMPFRKNSETETWDANPMVYWPAGGNLRFLCIACEDNAIDMKECARWSDNDCTQGVEVIVADGSLLDSELLFSNAFTGNKSKGSVNLELKHSQCWLQFRLRCAQNNIMRIDSIVVRKPYTGGRFTVRNDVFATGDWSFRGHYRKDLTVPLSTGLVLSASGEKTCNLLLPEQASCVFDIHYSLRVNESQPWEEAVSECFSTNPALDCWYYGTRYVYDITASFTDISVIVHSTPWENNELNITT